MLKFKIVTTEPKKKEEKKFKFAETSPNRVITPAQTKSDLRAKELNDKRAELIKKRQEEEDEARSTIYGAMGKKALPKYLIDQLNQQALNPDFEDIWAKLSALGCGSSYGDPFFCLQDFIDDIRKRGWGYFRVEFQGNHNFYLVELGRNLGDKYIYKKAYCTNFEYAILHLYVECRDV